MKLATSLVRGLLYALCTPLILAAAHSADFAYSMTLKSDMKMDIGGSKSTVVADTALAYTWKHTPQTQVLSINSMAVKSTSDGKVLMDTSMDVEKFVDGASGATPETTVIRDAPPELQAMVKDTFEVPIFTRHMGSSGEVTSTEITAKAGAKDFVENGIIANAILFHPIHVAGKDTWKSDAQISMGNGGYAKGQLTYTKIAGKRGSTYSVSGTLSCVHYQKEGTPVGVSDAVYKVTGVHAYDDAAQAWNSGKFTIALTFELASEKKKLGSAVGTMEATMRLRGK